MRRSGWGPSALLVMSLGRTGVDDSARGGLDSPIARLMSSFAADRRWFGLTRGRSWLNA